MTKPMPIYFDYAATTPVDPRVAEQMSHCLLRDGFFGNAHSNHAFGEQAKIRIEKAREYVAALLRAVPRNIIFTAGATEANNLAIKGVSHFYKSRGMHIVTANTEHKSVLETYQSLEQEGFSVSYLKADQNGLIDIDILKSVIRKDTILVSIMHVNNETGVIQDIESIAKIVRAHGSFIHVDAAQSVGKIPIDLQQLPVDLLSFSGHKMYGPKGIGALYIGDNPRVRLSPQLLGGGQERKLRAGTLATHQIVGLGEACRILTQSMHTEIQTIRKLRDCFWAGIQDLPQVLLNGQLTASLPNIINIQFRGLVKDALLKNLEGIAVSTGSACNSMTIEPSYVLRAMGLTDNEADCSLRFSFGRYTTAAEIETAIQCIRAAVKS